MKLTVERGYFYKALSHGQSVVERRNTVPILGHVLLTAEQDLKLTTTDMDLALIESVPADVGEKGQTTVSAHMLFDIVRKLPDKVIQLTFNPTAQQLTLECGRSVFHLSCLPAEEFPQITKAEISHFFHLPSPALRKLLDSTRFAMSTEETRYYLNGIYLHTHIQQGTSLLRAVATDAHRLACAEVPCPENAEKIPSVIISRKTVMEIRKLLEETEEEIQIGVSTNRIQFSLATATLTARLIDGQFPQYENVIPVQNDKLMIVDTKSLSSAVDRVATLANEKVRVIKLDLSPRLLALSAVNQEIGQAREELEVDYDKADTIAIGFNPKYLMDVMQQINEEEAQLSFFDNRTPAMIRGVNDTSSFYILMPILV